MKGAAKGLIDLANGCQSLREGDVFESLAEQLDLIVQAGGMNGSEGGVHRGSRKFGRLGVRTRSLVRGLGQVVALGDPSAVALFEGQFLLG